MNEKTFSRWLVGIFVFSISAVALFNFLINPLDLFPAKVIPGINDGRYISNVRLYKNFYVRRHPVQGLMLGSSRTEEGMNPLPAAWNNMSVYNMAMPGAMIKEMHRNLQHASHSQSLQQVLIGLDFFMFSAFQENVDDFSEDYFVVDEDGNAKPNTYVFRTYINVLFSADGFNKSWRTLKGSLRGEASSHEPSGMVSQVAHNAKLETDTAVIHEFAIFQKSYFKKGGYWLNGPNSTYTTENKLSGDSTLQDFEALLEYIYAKHIPVVFVISPVHVRMLLGMEDIGLQPQFVAWKQQLARSNERIAARHQRAPLPLWDFAVVNDYTAEALPDLAQPEDSRKHGMQWFWDPAHYKPAFGDLIQQRVFITGEEDLGVRLSSASIAAHLQTQQQVLQEFRLRNPQTADDIRTTVISLNTYQWITSEKGQP